MKNIRCLIPILAGLITFMFIVSTIEFAIKASLLAILFLVIYYLIIKYKNTIANIKSYWTRYWAEYNKL